MKYHLSAIAAVGALAAVSFAAPASAEPIWQVNGTTNLVCESMTVSAALPPAGTALFGAPAFFFDVQRPVHGQGQRQSAVRWRPL